MGSTAAIEEICRVAVLRRVLYSAPSRRDPERSVFAVLSLTDGEGEFRASGEVSLSALGPSPEGVEYRISGRWVDHPRYGRQLEILSISPSISRSEAGAMRYLARYEGIGSVTAQKVVAALGVDCLDTLAADPKRLDAVQGLNTPQRSAVLKAADEWRAASVAERTLSWLMRHGLGPTQAARVVGELGEETKPVLERDPWRLADLDGFGFATADAFARSLGVDPRSPRRVEAAVRHALVEAAGDGHVFLPAGELEGRVRDLLDDGGWPPDEVVSAGVRALSAAGSVVEQDKRVYLPGLHQAERTVAEWVRRRAVAAEGSGGGAPA